MSLKVSESEKHSVESDKSGLDSLQIRLPVMVCQTFFYHIPDPLIELRVCGNTLRERLRRAVELVCQELGDLAVSEWGKNAKNKVYYESGDMRHVGIHNLENSAFRPRCSVCKDTATSMERILSCCGESSQLTFTQHTSSLAICHM